MRFSHNFCLRDAAWIHPAYVWTKRGDVGTTNPTELARQEPLPKRSKYRFASLQHHPLIIAQAWNGCSCPPQGSGQSEWATGQFNGRESVDSRGSRFRVEPGSAICRLADIEKRIQ
jgi:hypothetical protein